MASRDPSLIEISESHSSTSEMEGRGYDDDNIAGASDSEKTFTDQEERSDGEGKDNSDPGNVEDDGGKKPALNLVKDSEDWVDEDVWQYTSDYTTPESIERLKGKIKVVGSEEDKSHLALLPCLPDDRVSSWYYDPKQPNWVFMYEHVFSVVGLTLPFSSFQIEVLRILNVAPSQLHPNGWGFVRAFEILMGHLGVVPSVEMFFYFFQNRGVDKGLWISLNGCPRRKIFKLFQSSFKDFKPLFFRVGTSTPGKRFLLDNRGVEYFPLFWRRDPRRVKGLDLEFLLERDRIVVQFLEENIGGADKALDSLRLVRLRNDAVALSSYICKLGSSLYFSSGLNS